MVEKSKRRNECMSFPFKEGTYKKVEEGRKKQGYMKRTGPLKLSVANLTNFFFL